MDCAELARLLSERRLVELTAEEQEGVAVHVKVCEPCRRKWGLDRESQALHSAEKAFPPHVSLKDAVMAKLARETADAELAETKKMAVEPKRIGGFEVLERLGQGGMGAVFKARQISMDRIVALKVLSPSLAEDEAFVRRFVREARSAAKLSHPNIVQGIDVGHADGYHYFAMEFVDGLTVRDLINQEGQIEEERAVKTIRAVALALVEAQGHGIIHRDIKPDNIMITRKGEVKLADLGLARSTEKLDTVTAVGTTVGTPPYMSPEQVRGEAGLDARADIYALGATLYHMVTGECPFKGPTAAATMALHITERVPPPKEKNPELCSGTCNLIQRMMAKRREDRPQTPSELLEEIEEVLEHIARSRSRRSAEAAMLVAHPKRPVGSAPACRSRRALPWVGAAALVLVCAGLCLALARARRAGQALPPGDWVSLFDGKTLRGWRLVEEAQFANHGRVYVDEGRIVLERGDPRTGIAWTGQIPNVDYEIALEVMRLEGMDTFCVLCFPICDSQCVFVFWGGTAAELERVDGREFRVPTPASRENDERGGWYCVRLRVTKAKIEAWIDQNKIIDLPTVGREFTIYPRHLGCLAPLGISTYETTAALRKIMLRRVAPKPG